MNIRVRRLIDGRWRLVQHSTRHVHRHVIAVNFAGNREVYDRKSGELIESDYHINEDQRPSIPIAELATMERTIEIAVSVACGEKTPTQW